MPETRKKHRPPIRKPNPVHRAEYTRFRAHLLRWRNEAGLSQRELANHLDRSLAWVNRCETGGRRMDALEWLSWIEACGVDATNAVRQLRKG